MGNATSSSHQTVTVPANGYIQLPNKEGNSLTLLNKSNTNLIIKELGAPALTSYSFKNYNPSNSAIPEPAISWEKSVGFGQISTIENGIGANKIFKAESVDKRLAAYTKLSSFTDKNDLELSFDFYNPAPKICKITKMEITADVPLDWEWGTTYTTGGGCYGGGIGTTLFENPNWNIKFTISNFTDLNNNLYFQQRQGNQKGFEGFRLVIYREDLVAGATNYRYWCARPTRVDYRANQQELDIYVPLYKMAGIRVMESSFICVEQLQNDKNICRITPFQKVSLRAYSCCTSNGSAKAVPEFIADESLGAQPQIILDNVIREGSNFLLNFRYANFPFTYSQVQWSNDPNFANFTSSTGGVANYRIQPINYSTTIYFRIMMNGALSNVLAYDATSRSNKIYTKGTYGIVRKNFGTSADPEKYYVGLSLFDETGTYNNSADGSGFLFDKSNVSSSTTIRSTSDENKTLLIRLMTEIRSNTSVNLFAFANWSSKPYPQNLPFKDHPTAGKDAYRISLDIYNNTVQVYHGSSNLTNSSSRPAYLLEDSIHPHFLGWSNLSNNTIPCNNISNIGLWMGSSTLKNNDWNTFKVKFNKGIIRVYLNKFTNGQDRLLFEFNDPNYSSRNIGNYIGVTTTHNFAPSFCGRSFNGEIVNSYPGLPADLEIKNFKINSQNISNILETDIDSLPDLTLSSNTGLELDGISNANQFFLKNTSSAPVNVTYRLTD